MKHKIMTLIGSLAVVLFSATAVSAKIITLNWGDTLSKLAAKYNTTINFLQEKNNISDPNKIFAGQTLNVPEQDNISYWVERIKNQSINPLTTNELKEIPEDAWLEIEPQIVNFAPPNDSLGGNSEPNVLQTILCRGNECDKFKDKEALGFSVVSRYRTTLRSSMTTNQVTIPVSTIVTFDGHTLTMADLGNSVYLTVEPGTNNEEIIKCTAISSSQWASCTRGLAFYGTSESSISANQKPHNAGSIVVMSNVHYVYEQLIDKDTSQTLSGDFTVSSSTATSTLKLGNGATTYDKCIKVHNGSSNNPKFCYVESQSKWLLFNDGVNSYDVTAGGSGLAAGKGTAINSGKIDLDISNTSTQSLGFTGSQPRVELSTGGGIARSSDGLSVDQTANYTWINTHSFSATTTFATTTIASSTIQQVNSTNHINQGTVTSTITDTRTLCFSGANCSNGISGLISTVSTTDFGSITGTNTTAAGTYEEYFPLSFLPKIIQLNYYVQGHDSSVSTNEYFKNQGTAWFMGTNSIGGWYLHCDQDTSDNTCGTTVDATTQMFTGVDLTEGTGLGNNEDIQMTMAVSSVSSTGIAFTCTTAIGGGTNSSVGRCKGSWVAFR